MFNRILILFVAMFVFTGISFADDTRKQEYCIQYSEFRGKSVGLEIDPNDGGVSLYVYIRNGNDWKKRLSGDTALNFLRNEVLRMTSKDGPVRLGDSDFILEFQGKYPIWGPYTGLNQSGEIKYIHFAKNAKLNGNTIVVQGIDEPNAYDGYKLWKPNINE